MISVTNTQHSLCSGVYVTINITVLDNIHRLVFYLKTRRFGDWIRMFLNKRQDDGFVQKCDSYHRAINGINLLGS
jgi:hypothetical protein